MNILVTGSEGFIGKHVIKHLSKKHNVIELDRKMCCYEIIDLTGRYVKDKKIDVCINLAAQTSVWNDNHIRVAQDNIVSFIHLFNICKSNNIKFIHASSSCAKNVTSMYGLSKLFDEEYASIYGWENCFILRLHNVYGKNPRKDTLFGKLMKSDHDNPITLYNNGDNIRHFTYIDDVIKAFDICLSESKSDWPYIYNVVNPQVMTTKEFCDLCIKENPGLSYKLTDENRALDKSYQIVDDMDSKIDLNFTSVEEGVKKIFDNGKD